MLAELIELCLEPKRINDLQNLEFLFSDYHYERQSQTDLNEQNLNVDLDNQPARIPIPDLFPQQVQQYNRNQAYQLPLQQQQYNQELLNDNNLINRNSTNRNNQSISNQQNSNDKLLKSNLSESIKNIDDICSCSCNNLNNLHNLSNKNISKKITDDNNWQSGLTSVRSRNAALFDNDYLSDVTFLVNDCDNISDDKNDNLTNNKLIRIPAHKYILSTGSSVFYAMFNGPLAEKADVIKLEDDDAQGIKTLFRYLYCDDICLNKENVLSTFYVSTKYFVPYLTRACINYLKQISNSQNACILLSQIRLYDETEFINHLFDIIDAQSEQAFKSESFVDIDQGTLELILKRETLHSTTEENIELIIFNALNRWSEKECVRKELEVNSINKRKILEKLIYLVRIPTMSLSDFANSVAQTKLLDSDTTTNLFLYYTASSSKNQSIELIDKFNFKKRKGLELNSVQRFQSFLYKSNMWKYKGRSDAVNFCVDKKIFIIGFGLYGSTEVGSVYKLKMELRRNGKLLAYKSDLNLVSDGTSNTFKFMFDHSIEIKPNILYTTSVTIDGDSLSYFGQDGLAEVCWKKASNNVTFNFQCSNTSANGTGVIGGQLPEILFYLPSLDNELLNKNIE